MSYVKLSKKSVEALKRWFSPVFLSGNLPLDVSRAMVELTAATKMRKPKPLRTERLKEKRAKKVGRKELRSQIRATVEARAAGACECLCGRSFQISGPAHWDHFFGRGRAESVETTWMLAPECDRAKTLNLPCASEWLERFIDHCERHGYASEASRARARLEGICAVRKAEAGRG